MPRIGVISDTHGRLRPEAVAALQGCEAILHGGDIGSADILARLSAIAPTTAVRGNNDKGDWASDLSEREWIDIDGVLVHLLHDIADWKFHDGDLQALAFRGEAVDAFAPAVLDQLEVRGL